MPSSAQAPRYYRSGSANGFSFNTGDVLVEDRKESGALEGWYVYPAASFGSAGTVHKEFRWEVESTTIKGKIVHGNDAGGRINVEVENVFHGGAGDDLIVAYAGSPLDYGTVGDRTPGAFLSAGAGDDTLLGSRAPTIWSAGQGMTGFTAKTALTPTSCKRTPQRPPRLRMCRTLFSTAQKLAQRSGKTSTE